MANLLKILKERQAKRPATSAEDTAEQVETLNSIQPVLPFCEPLAQSETSSVAEDEREIASLSPQIRQAQEVARRTREFLATRGWCLWKCSALAGDIIAVVLDEKVEGVPEGYSVYTEAELEELCKDDVSEATLRLVHEAKKLVGAKVVSV